VSTVGYGDAVPTTQLARAFAVSFVVVGTAAFAFALDTLITPVIETRLSKALGRVTRLQLESLEGHVVLGYSEVTSPILTELSDRSDFVVLTSDPDTAAKLRERDHMVVNANPSNEDALRKARIERARAVVAATNDDAEDVLAVLTARQMNPDVRVVVLATDEGNVGKLRRAGADTVISPAGVVGDLLVESAPTGEDKSGMVDEVMKEELPKEDSEKEGSDDRNPDGKDEDDG